MNSADETKRLERETYDPIAEVYDAAFGSYSARFASDLIDLLYPQNTDAALDVAGGTGAAGLRLADRIGREGSVTIIDLSPMMLQVAAANAAARGISNLETRAMDAHKLEFPDSSFDIVTCCMAAAAFPDIERAVAEAYRVLRPGGRIGFVVWSRADRVPVFSVPALALIRRRAPLPVRLAVDAPIFGGGIRRRLLNAAGTPGYSPVRFAAKGSLEKYLCRAGFRRIRRELRGFPLEYPSYEACWEALPIATPALRALAGLPPDILAQVKAELREQFVNSRTGEVLMFNEAALVLATKTA